MIFQRRLHATDDELSAYLDGRLAGGRRERVGSLVNGCAICTEALDELRAVQASLRSLPRAPAPRSFALREARPASVREARGFVGAMPLLSGVTAISMIAFFAVLGVDMQGGGASSSSPSKAAGVLSGDRTAPGVTVANYAAESTENNLRLTVTAPGAPVSSNVDSASPQATPEPAATTSESGGGDTELRVAEAALAALALVSAGTAVAVSRRRRA